MQIINSAEGAPKNSVPKIKYSLNENSPDRNESILLVIEILNLDGFFSQAKAYITFSFKH